MILLKEGSMSFTSHNFLMADAETFAACMMHPLL